MPKTLSQLRQKLYSLHCCIYSKMKRWMLFLYVMLSLGPRPTLFSPHFLISSSRLLIIHHHCSLEHPSGCGYWAVMLRASFLRCQVLPVLVRGPAAFLSPLHGAVGPSDFPLLECSQRDSLCERSPLPSLAYNATKSRAGVQGAR